ncbi:hypothetical protein [Nocardia cyriacigeorgica]|uniref:hypothetical protein n=1 Tax=Nocardia cyriacigeorgica TaxID=135487 RepID=UPI0002E40EA5|nr:hypothetical protein [Nocardia cyriacigeorgica]
MVTPVAGLAPVPAGWADEQALGLVLNWATALAALKPLGRLSAGETMLVHAAAGGVGRAHSIGRPRHDRQTGVAAVTR